MDQLLARRTQFKCYDLLAKLIMAAKLPKEFSISKLDCCSDICHLQMKRIINAAVPEFTIS